MLSKILSAEQLCICGKPLGEETLILIESGQMRPSEKDPRFLRFHPDWKLPQDQWPDPGNPESALRLAVHFECFREQFNEADLVWRLNPVPNECNICTHSFNSRERWAYRYTMGDIIDGLFEPDPEMPTKGIVCSFCAARLAQDPADSQPRTQTGQQVLF